MNEKFVHTPCSTCAHAAPFLPMGDAEPSEHYVRCMWKPSPAPFWFMGPMHSLNKDLLVKLKQNVDHKPVVCDVWVQGQKSSTDQHASYEAVIHAGDLWHADEDADCVRLFRGHLQIAKMPKRDTPFEEYWPDPLMLTWILQVLNAAEQSGQVPVSG